MIHFTTFFALVVGSMEVIQPAAAAEVKASLSPRIDHGFVRSFQRRQFPPFRPPSGCEARCQYVDRIINEIIAEPARGCLISDCCSDTFVNSYSDCCICTAAVLKLPDFTIPQKALDQNYASCLAIHMAPRYFTFPGQPTDRPLPSPIPTHSVPLPASSTDNSILPKTYTTIDRPSPITQKSLFPPTATHAATLSTVSNVALPPPPPTQTKLPAPTYSKVAASPPTQSISI